MTTRPKPLFYGTAKCVALYMNPNVRLQLFFRCPMFQTVHRNQTLRIRDLIVRPDKFEIDGTIYKLGVITQYTNKLTPTFLYLRNNEGGLQTDVDVYGLPINTTGNMRDDKEEIEILQREIKRLEENQRKLGFYDNFIQILFEIEEAQSKIDVLQMRIYKSPSSCRNHLRLTVITGENYKKELVAYEKPFKLAREYLERRIFCNGYIQVRNLQIGEDFKKHDLLDGIPLEPLFRKDPQGDLVKPLLSIREGCLEVEMLKVTKNLTNALTSLRTVLSAAVPLKHLRTVNQSFPDDPIIKTSQLVSMVGKLPFYVLSRSPNNRTHIDSYTDFPSLSFTDVVNEWMESDMSVGTYYSMGIHAAPFLEGLFNLFRKLPGAETAENKETRSTRFPECVIIPMKNNTELNVYCNEPNNEEKEYCSTEFILKMKWQPKGYARVVK
ncbi:hypothetical protein GCK72_004305 [Caenorhabditis remanei]|uniref:DUF38 domain-containing protein n=1 Tax=Caenorhabditis remanei TaxID=31234 RepID=A0A6A5H9E5_CAERE|nr:hypothetical protein GCK72_004305 [Caenorhabditis remanei]KAF1764358.1 hypothetical protein GCK72_004305 [Caenorhabditis remanei]